MSAHTFLNGSQIHMGWKSRGGYGTIFQKLWVGGPWCCEKFQGFPMFRFYCIFNNLKKIYLGGPVLYPPCVIRLFDFCQNMNAFHSKLSRSFTMGQIFFITYNSWSNYCVLNNFWSLRSTKTQLVFVKKCLWKIYLIVLFNH